MCQVIGNMYSEQYPDGLGQAIQKPMKWDYENILIVPFGFMLALSKGRDFSSF